MKTTKEVRAELEAQPVLQPGQFGWWRVWAAVPREIQPGDYVLCRTEVGVDEFYVQDTFKAKAYPLRIGLVVDGEKQTMGSMCSITLLRQGTKHSLLGYRTGPISQGVVLPEEAGHEGSSAS